jgi:hypothetical protein
MDAKRSSRYGIAGWPLRTLSLDNIARAIRGLPIVEIPKDLLNSVSAKALFSVLATAHSPKALAGTTDFTKLAGLVWDDYRRYLDVQIAYGRFLRCNLFRVFLGAANREELKNSIDKLNSIARDLCDIEPVIETHGGFESTMEGFTQVLEASSSTLVVDFANIRDPKLIDFLLTSPCADRIAYFHVRNLPLHCEVKSLIEVEATAFRMYPDHAFLWEPKSIDGVQALEIFKKLR